MPYFVIDPFCPIPLLRLGSILVPSEPWTGTNGNIYCPFLIGVVRLRGTFIREMGLDRV